MFIYLDESGDLGFDFENKKPSSHFVITLLVCRDQETATIIKKAVAKTRKNKFYGNHKYKNFSELKGTKASINVKKYFYKNAIQSHRWSIYSIILNKKFTSFIDKAKIYNTLTNHLLKQVNFSKVSAINLFVDRSKNQDGISEFDDMLRINMRKNLRKTIPFNISHVASHHNDSIQAVDLFCWGILRKYTYNDEEWYSIFKTRIVYEEQYHQRMEKAEATLTKNKMTAPIET